MSANSDQIVDRLAEQLCGFEDQLRVSGTGADVLAGIKESIGDLLTIDIENESLVRGMLQEQFEKGLLRKNSFRVVVSIVDQILSESSALRLQAANAEVVQQSQPRKAKQPAMPAPEIDPALFDSTVILPKDTFANIPPRKEIGPGTMLGERFLLHEVVATGTIGTLYLAFDTEVEALHKDETRVAVVVISPAIAKEPRAFGALKKLAKRVGRLAHPHIVHFTELCRDDDVAFMVMEWMDGRSLDDLLESGDARRIDRVAALRIVREVANALDYAHRCGVVHADVRPGNIMIAQDGSARLRDCVTARAKLMRVRAQTGRGTRNQTYASKQVLNGERLTPPDDVFSLACLLYRLVAGYRVFGPRNAAEAFEQGMQPQRPEGFDDAQWRAVSKALSPERDDRFASVVEFIDALDGAAELNASVTQLRFGERNGGRRPGAWLIAGVAAILLVGSGLYWAGTMTAGSANDQDAQAGAGGESSGGAVDGQRLSRDANRVPKQKVLVSETAPGSRDAAASGEPAAAETAASAPADAIQTLPPVAEITATYASANMAVNAVGFADDQVVVYEADSAVQIDVTRFNADGQSFSIGYFVNDITASDGQDYFAPDSYSLAFGPGQSTARLLIPLVQDTVDEGDETFIIRLLEHPLAAPVVERQSIVVTIRDGAPQTP